MGPALPLERRLLAQNYPSTPFVIRHSLTAHRLFELDRLLELGRALPAAHGKSK